MPLKRALPIVRYSENQGYVTHLILFLIPVPGTYSPQDQTKQFTAHTTEEFLQTMPDTLENSASMERLDRLKCLSF